MAIPIIAEPDFESEVLRSELPVLIAFTTERSPATKQLEPELAALAHELEGKLKIVKVDTDKSKRIVASLRIQAVPTYMVFSRGRPVAADQGVLRRAELRALAEPFLPRAEGAVRANELVQLLKEGQVSVVDAREATAFGRAHIPGAVNIPIDEVENRLAELHMLPASPIVYCRAGDKTKDLAQKLADDGIPVGFLEGGFLSWEAEGLPIERP